MSQKEKRRHLFKTFVKSKGLFACFSLVLSLLLVMGSTYAWITSSDERVNRADANYRRVSAIVVEDFSQVFQWAPGTTKEKKVRVKNTGDVPAVIRIALKEFFVGFETDVTDNHAAGDGNGNLKVYGTPSNTAIDVKNTDTWVRGNTYGVSADTHYKAETVLLDETYPYNGSRTLPLGTINLNFQSGKVFDLSQQPGQNDRGYWYYEKGYFYYSEVLQPNEVTTDLLESVSLDAAYTNRYKGGLYKLVPEMDAHDITRGLLADWAISNSDFAYSMYTDKLDKAN